jgi:endonuclease/exonuclease/phosphatase family metal-dependent hydrolase
LGLRRHAGQRYSLHQRSPEGGGDVLVKVGIFNLNNLFSRYNFQGEVQAIAAGDKIVEAQYEFTDPTSYRLRTFMGRLVKGKDPQDTVRIASRIAAMDLDVLAVQEVEDIGTLKRFVIDNLATLYPHVVLVEGNDSRLIDVALLSKLPMGAITSWQRAVHPSEPSAPVFGRDLLQVEILNASRTRRLFTLFNTHLKSHFLSPGETAADADERRQRQAEVAATIIQAQTRPNSAYLVTGDMNDPPSSQFLAPLVGSTALNLVNGLANPTESRPAPADNPPATTTAWTHRFKPTGKPADYELFDHVWLSPALAGKQTAAFIERRTRLTGDGSDHDPAWVVLDI